jgi:ubiquinone/menaquinone biosynthesis C-methylase UbiE
MYDDIAPSYNELHGQEQERKLKALLARTNIPKKAIVLDVGCGTAHLAKYFQQQDYTGLDPSKGLLAQAPKNVKVLMGRGEELPFADDSFDLVLSLTALHNYSDPIKGVQELHRTAKSQALVGVLRKHPSHDDIIKALEDLFSVEHKIQDQHDTLLVLRKA